MACAGVARVAGASCCLVGVVCLALAAPCPPAVISFLFFFKTWEETAPRTTSHFTGSWAY